MKNIFNILIATACAVSLSGCVYVDGNDDSEGEGWESQQHENQEIINNLELGLEFAYARTRLGSPSFSEAFTRGDEEYRILYYRTHRLHSDGNTTKDETTPVVFKNGKLIGWGSGTLLSAQRL